MSTDDELPRPSRIDEAIRLVDMAANKMGKRFHEDIISVLSAAKAVEDDAITMKVRHSDSVDAVQKHYERRLQALGSAVWRFLHIETHQSDPGPTERRELQAALDASREDAHSGASVEPRTVAQATGSSKPNPEKRRPGDDMKPSEAELREAQQIVEEWESTGRSDGEAPRSAVLRSAIDELVARRQQAARPAGDLLNRPGLWETARTVLNALRLPTTSDNCAPVEAALANYARVAVAAATQAAVDAARVEAARAVAGMGIARPASDAILALRGKEPKRP